MSCSFFFFKDTATTEIYTLSLHDALPILTGERVPKPAEIVDVVAIQKGTVVNLGWVDRYSTRLNSSHQIISYALFCLKNKYLVRYYHAQSLKSTVSP